MCQAHGNFNRLKMEASLSTDMIRAMQVSQTFTSLGPVKVHRQ